MNMTDFSDQGDFLGGDSELREDLIAGMEGLSIEDDNIDNNSFHAKYEDDEIIAEASAMGSTKDNLKHFSKDMRSDHYKIRDPEVQRQWGEKKTEMQKRTSKVLLLTDYALRALYDECSRLVKQTGEPRLFTVISRDEEGKVSLSYAKEHVVLMHQTLGLYLDGKTQMTRKQLINLLVDEYHLSYHHFVKKHATLIINKSANVQKKLRVWDKCNYEVLSHPVMLKSIKRLENLKVRGNKKLIESARADVMSDFRELNNELEIVLEEKAEVMLILSESVGRPDFILRLLKALVNSFEQYRNRLVETNLRLVLSIAHANKNKASASNISVTDLISEGTEGLLKASEMYVSGIGVKFTTYAEPWVSLKITRHIKNTNDVRIPIHCTDLMYRICKYFKKIDVKEGENLPSKVEVEAQLKERITDEIWEMAVNRFNGISVSVSCDHSGAFDDDSVSFDHILGDKSEEANGELEQNVFSTSILAIAKDVLSDNEYKVLTRYYLQDENYVEIHHHLDRPYSSKSISMIKTRAIAKVQARIEEMGGLATIRPL
jgi:RNA polymerase sigma factor (sigma-70 family)